MSLAQLRKVTETVTKKYPGVLVDPDVNTLIHKVSFDSPQLTYMMNGFSVDRIHQFWGPESAGKSSLCTYIAYQLQKKMPEYIEKWGDELTEKGKDGKEFKKKLADKQVVVYMDFERTFDPSHAAQIGLNMDEDHFILEHPETLEDGAKIALEYMKTGSVCCVILDSDAMATTTLDLESDPGDTGFNGAKGANVLKQVYKHFNLACSNYLTPLLVISQERANMNVASHLPSVTGGQAIKFASSTRQRISKLETLTGPNGDNVGLQIRVRNYKNKTGIPWRDSEMFFYFSGGFDEDQEYATIMVPLDILHKETNESGRGTGWFTNAELGIKIRGEGNITSWLLEHPTEYEQLKKMVNDKLMSHNELDSNIVEVDENADFAPDDKPDNVSVDDLEKIKKQNEKDAVAEDEAPSPDLGLA